MATRKLGDYQFVEAVPDKFKCWQCKELLEEPHVTECCGQHLCMKCIAKSASKQIQQRKLSTQKIFQARSTECPSCKIKNFKHIRYLPLKRKINKLIVYCPHKANGCSEQVKLESIVAHVSGCDYQAMWCTNSCGQGLLKKQLQDHLTKTCTNRTVACQYCGKHGQYAKMPWHLEVCPEFPITCPNRCEQLGLKRKDMDNHKETCPLEMVKCTFAEVGCTRYGQRKDLAAHVKTSVEIHLSLMMTAHLKLKQEVQKMNLK